MSAINFVDYFFRKINGVKRVSFDANLERQSGEGTYLFANGLPIGMATVGDCQGVKMEFEYGVAPSAASIAGNGKMAHGLNIKMTMDQDWDFDLKPYNGTIRCATLQAVSEDDVSGRLEGAYINAQASGTTKTIEGYISGATGPGIIGIEARTELATSASITTPSAVGVLIFHQCKANADLTGMYRGLQVEVPLILAGGSITSTTYAMYVGNDWGGADTFDYGLYIKTGTCTKLLYGACALAVASTALHLVVSDTYTGTSNVKGIQVQMTKTSGTTSGAGEFAAIAGEIQLKATTSHAWAFTAYTGVAASGASGDMAAYRCYCDNLGSYHASFSEYECLSLHIDSTNEASGGTAGNCFIMAYAHGAAPSSFIRLPSSVGIDHLVWFQQAVAPYAAGGAGTCTVTGGWVKIAIKVGTTTYYIPAGVTLNNS